MLRGFFLIFFLTGIALVAFLGFRGQHSTGSPIELFPDMVRQPKVRAQAPLGFFADDRGSRVPVAGTVPIGYDMPVPTAKASPGAPALPAGPASHPRLSFSEGETDYLSTGKMGTNWGTGIPLPVTPELMARGQQRFNINCAVCHGGAAAGNGITKQYGLATVVSLQDERIRTMADGEIFNTITHGKNTMLAYGPNVTVNDRWAIITYLRALQRSQNSTLADVPPEARGGLEKK
ncbi:MAG: c-type cytochrome [Chthoniobacterales bacterium]